MPKLQKQNVTKDLQIKKILAKKDEYSKLEKITVWGRVYSVRGSKKIIFADIFDGSTLETLQLIFSRELLLHLTLGSVLKVSGKLVLVPEREHQPELKVAEINYLSLAPADPYCFANHPLKWLRMEKKKEVELRRKKGR